MTTEQYQTVILSKDKLDVLLERHAGDTDGFLAAYTAEVHKQDTELIRQMLEAIEAETSDAWDCNSHHPKLYAAVAAGRARLENT